MARELFCGAQINGPIMWIQEVAGSPLYTVRDQRCIEMRGLSPTGLQMYHTHCGLKGKVEGEYVFLYYNGEYKEVGWVNGKSNLHSSEYRGSTLFIVGRLLQRGYQALMEKEEAERIELSEEKENLLQLIRELVEEGRIRIENNEIVVD